MRFNQDRTHSLSRYFSDLSKITFGSAVLGFFLPTITGAIGVSVFLGGVIATVSFLVFSIKLLE